MTARHVVIGAGPTGLAAAMGLDAVVLEREAEVGGLCRSINVGGGTFDIGGHSWHSPHPEVLALVEDLMGAGMEWQDRDARVHWAGRLIPYPFQRHYRVTGDADLIRECDAGLARAGGDAANFDEHLGARFGAGIADAFLRPYNRKLWGADLARLSHDWTAERVAGMTDRETPGQRQPMSDTMRVGYPAVGGFGGICWALAQRVSRVELRAEVARIDTASRTVHLADGRTYRWRDALVSTLPLPVLVRMCGAPKHVREVADGLEALPLRVDMLLVGRLETPVQRIYVADDSTPAHKIALNHNSSSSLRARPVHAITAETSLPAGKAVDLNTPAAATAHLLVNVGVLDSLDAVVWSGHTDVRYGYPVYTHDRADRVAQVRSWLDGRGIISAGRFGDWQYANSDWCILRGLNIARDIGGRAVA